MIILKPAKMAHKSTPKIVLVSRRIGSLGGPAEPGRPSAAVKTPAMSGMLSRMLGRSTEQRPQP
jgi:hypothetical protein